MRFRFIFIIIFLLPLIILSGCKFKHKTVTIGMIPYNNPTEIKESFEGIRLYLEQEMKTSISVKIMDDYVSLIEAMKDKKVDLGVFGPFSYVAGEKEIDLEPLVVMSRKTSGTTYHSLIITHKSSDIKTIEDLKNKDYAFVDPGSTSGYVMPFALFRSRDINIESYFSSICFSGSHDQVGLDVVNKKVDAGSMDDLMLNKLIDNGKIASEDIRIIWQSDPIPGSPYIARADISQSIKDSFKQAMITLHQKDIQALEQYSSRAEKYVECSSSSYNYIRNVASVLGDEFIIEKFLNKK